MKNRLKPKLLVICGPTSSGKSSLAIRLARQFDGELISADSRQVYRHMDIGTGKEWGDGIKIWGYDLVDPAEKYSVSDFVKFSHKALKDIWSRNKLPILVGGTGLYIKAVVEGIDTIDIPKNENLRQSLGDKSAEELFERLAILDSGKAASMNTSDRKNNRRLIRAIEVAIWKLERVGKMAKKEWIAMDTLFIGLRLSPEIIREKIKKRVERRIDDGFIYEVESLLKMGVSWKEQSMQSLGYKESEKFLKKGQSHEEFIDEWTNNEIRYVKRQMTWFNKVKDIRWFDVSSSEYPENVEFVVNKWHNMENA